MWATSGIPMTEFTIDNWDGHPGFQLGIGRSSSGMKGCKFWASKAASAVVIMKRIRASFTLGNLEFSHLGKVTNVKDGQRGFPFWFCEDTEKQQQKVMLHVTVDWKKGNTFEPVMTLTWIIVDIVWLIHGQVRNLETFDLLELGHTKWQSSMIRSMMKNRCRSPCIFCSGKVKPTSLGMLARDARVSVC